MPLATSIRARLNARIRRPHHRGVYNMMTSGARGKGERGKSERCQAMGYVDVSRDAFREMLRIMEIDDAVAGLFRAEGCK